MMILGNTFLISNFQDKNNTDFGLEACRYLNCIARLEFVSKSAADSGAIKRNKGRPKQ